MRRAFEADQIPATQWKNVLRSLNQILEEEGVTLMVSAAEPKRTRKSVAAKSPAKRTATKTVAAKTVTTKKATATTAPAVPMADDPAEDASAKKVAAKKTVAKKAVAKKTVAKKAVAKKTTAKKDDVELIDDGRSRRPRASPVPRSLPRTAPRASSCPTRTRTTRPRSRSPRRRHRRPGQGLPQADRQGPLLNAEQEVELAKRIEAGLFAEDKLANADKLAPKLKRELEIIAEDGRRAKNHLLEANLRLVVSWPSATPAAACSSWTSSRRATSV